METITLDTAKSKIQSLIEKTLEGEEFIFTDHDVPVIRLSPISSEKNYLERVRALKGYLKGMDTTIEREEDRV